MKKMQALCEYLLEKTGLPRQQFDSWAEQAQTILTGRDLGHGIELCRLSYTAVIEIMDYPGDGHELLALVAGWLMDNDPERTEFDLQDPEYDVALNDDLSASVTLDIAFSEAIFAVPDEAGAIRFAGRSWSISAVPIDVAENLDQLTGDTPDA